MNNVIEHDSGAEIPEESKKNIVLMGQVEASLKQLSIDHKADPDCSTDEGYADAKAKQKAVAQVRIETEKAHKGAKAFYLEGGRKIDAMKNSILDAIGPIEEKYKAARKVVDDEKERIEQVAAEKEAERIRYIEERIREIKNAPSAAVSSEQVDAAIKMLVNVDFATFGEFSNVALGHIETAHKELTDKRELLVQHERDVAEVEVARKKQAAIDEQQRIDREEFEAEKRAFAEEQEATARRAAIEDAEQKAAAKAEREKTEALAQAERDKQAAIEKAKADAVIEENRKREAEEKRVADEKAKAERLAALAPDAEKLRKWFDSMNDIAQSPVPLPASMSTETGASAVLQIHGEHEIFLMAIEPIILALEGRDAV